MGFDSAFGQWMQQVFGGFDMACFAANAAIQCEPLTIVAKILSACGNTLFWVLLGLFALFLCCFRKTRKIGFVMAVAIVIVAAVSKFILNPGFGRLRPYNVLQSNADYFAWYLNVGGIPESEYSFPSKHAAVAFAVATALFVIIRFEYKKRSAYILFVVALLVSWSRNYLMVHYATDLIAGAIFGVIVGFLSLGIYDLVMMFVHKSPKLSLKLEQKWDLARKFTPKFWVLILVPVVVTALCFAVSEFKPSHKCEYNGRDYVCCNKGDNKIHVKDHEEYRCDLHKK